MKKSDGSMCKTPEENATVFNKHFQKLYGNQITYCVKVFELLPQRTVCEGYEEIPSDEEIRKTVSKLEYRSPGESGRMTKSWKSLVDSQELIDIENSYNRFLGDRNSAERMEHR